MRFSKEHVAGFLDSVKSYSIRPAAYRLGSKKSSTFGPFLLDNRTGLLEPVTTQIGFRLNAVGPNLKKSVNVRITKPAAQQLPAQKRWIADDEISVWPIRLLGTRWIAQVNDR